MPTPVKLSADKSLASHLAHCPRKALRPWEASPALLCWQMMITLGTERLLTRQRDQHGTVSVERGLFQKYWRWLSLQKIYYRQIFTFTPVILHNNYARLSWWIILSKGSETSFEEIVHCLNWIPVRRFHCWLTRMFYLMLRSILSHMAVCHKSASVIRGFHF